MEVTYQPCVGAYACLFSKSAANGDEISRDAIRTKLQIEGRISDLAMFNLAIDSKLRGCDIVALSVEDVAPNGYAIERATVRQKKTGQPVKFELTEQTRQAIDDYVKAGRRKPGEFLFTSRADRDRCISTRQYARLVSEWVASIGWDAKRLGTHSLRRTTATATLIYRRTGNMDLVGGSGTVCGLGLMQPDASETNLAET